MRSSKAATCTRARRASSPKCALFHYPAFICAVSFSCGLFSPFHFPAHSLLRIHFCTHVRAAHEDGASHPTSGAKGRHSDQHQRVQRLQAAPPQDGSVTQRRQAVGHRACAHALWATWNGKDGNTKHCLVACCYSRGLCDFVQMMVNAAVNSLGKKVLLVDMQKLSSTEGNAVAELFQVSARPK